MVCSSFTRGDTAKTWPLPTILRFLFVFVEQGSEKDARRWQPTTSSGAAWPLGTSQSSGTSESES